MKKLKELTFPPEAEEMAVKYAAFDIMKQLNKKDNRRRTAVYREKA